MFQFIFYSYNNQDFGGYIFWEWKSYDWFAFGAGLINDWLHRPGNPGRDRCSF